jgi:hypothetical protein
MANPARGAAASGHTFGERACLRDAHGRLRGSPAQDTTMKTSGLVSVVGATALLLAAATPASAESLVTDMPATCAPHVPPWIVVALIAYDSQMLASQQVKLLYGSELVIVECHLPDAAAVVNAVAAAFGKTCAGITAAQLAAPIQAYQQDQTRDALVYLDGEKALLLAAAASEAATASAFADDAPHGPFQASDALVDATGSNAQGALGGSGDRTMDASDAAQGDGSGFAGSEPGAAAGSAAWLATCTLYPEV